ncbi:hypothetical protein GIS00_13555 [Nakamurella sp. YIM 132087]|uniref:GTPase-associated protein 1 N-terminal domain-containing protein n=1 Tax=Nakamurella alba TaxID=2665158 RepID=A0A7K1FLI8_9ACTN|nr:hypothetical protein [Nakamurella alba]MTD14966.1 hypothetical protein [Nakamurella alba]
MLAGQFGYATVGEAGPYSDVDGWKVTAVRPAEDAAALQPWVESATGALGSFVPEALPLLASDEMIAALPRRLRLDPAADRRHRRSTLVHQVSAGQSHHYRDSWFAHGLLVQRSGQGAGVAGVRPAELWDSPLWVRPTGSAAVSAARLPDLDPGADLPAGPGSVAVQEVWAVDRDTALAVLAAAEEYLTAGTGALALADPTGARTAGWAAFLGRHLTVGAAWSALAFSTRETVEAGSTTGIRELHLIGYPDSQDPTEVAVALGTQWYVPDVGEIPTGAAARQVAPYRPPRPGPWTQLVERLTLLDDMGLPSLPDLVDRLSDAARGSADDRPLWAVPAALLLAGEETVELMAQVLPDAVALACRWWPPGLRLPGDRLALLRDRLVRFGRSTDEVFGAAVRSLDEAGAIDTGTGDIGASEDGTADGAEQAHDGEAAEGRDIAIAGYLEAVFAPGPDGVMPDWATPDRPLPWLPTRTRASAALVGRLLDELPARVGAMLAAARDPAVVVRLTTALDTVFGQWGAGDRLPAPVRAARVASLRICLLLDRAAVPGDGTAVWPTTSGETAAAVAAELETALAGDPAIALSPRACGWLTDRLGPPDLGRPLTDWSLVDLELASVRPADDPAGRTAALLRDAVRQPPGRPWTAAEWVARLTAVVGTSPAPTDLAGALHTLMGRQIPLPVPAIGEMLLAGRPLGQAEHGFARWLLEPRVLQSPSVRLSFRPGPTSPVLAVHARTDPQPPDGPTAPAYRVELQALAAALPGAGEPLAGAVRERLAQDVVVADAEFVAAGGWPWGEHGSTAVAGEPPAPAPTGLDDRWPIALEAVLLRVADRPDLGAALARSLLLRALLDEIVAAAGSSRYGRVYTDPLGGYLRQAPDGREWQVESWVKRLLDGRDRSARQQWAADCDAAAGRTVDRLLHRTPTGHPLHRPDVRTSFLASVHQNAPELALGVLGARLSGWRGRRPDSGPNPG